MKSILLTSALIGACSAQLAFKPAVAAGNVSESFLDEISGMFALRNESNKGKIITCHDSDSEYMFVLNADGSYDTRVNLVNDNWRDAEEISGYTKNGTNYVVLFEFGDNAANRDKKYIFRFEEPELQSGTVDVAEWDKIAYRIPDAMTLEKGQPMGDFEGAFVDVIDNKMYLFTKRMPVNYIYSLPIQDTYVGTQTLTFEGFMNGTVAEETGGVISPANCVGAALSQDGNHALIKTYNMVFQFTRPEGRTWADVLVNDSPLVETNYVGRGSPLAQEPQGESICFANDDTGYYTVSEFRGSWQVPLFYYAVQEDLPPFEHSYSKPAEHTHHFTVTNGYVWVLEASTNLRNWSEVTSPFVTVDNNDGTTTYIYTRQDKVREFFRFVVSVDKIDLTEYVRASILDAIAGLDPIADGNVFLDYSGGPWNLERNPNNFLNNLKGSTALVAWNSKSAGGGKYFHGAAITPRHIICAKHAVYQPGDTVYFITEDNEVITRYIYKTQGNGYNAEESDYVICLLEGDLPDTITPLEMIPADSHRYMSGFVGNTYTYHRMPYVWADQEERSLVGNFKSVSFSRFDDPTPDVYSLYGHAKHIIGFGLQVPDADLDPWGKTPIPGDSGSTNMIVMGDKLVAVGHFTKPAGGDWYGQLRNQNDFKRMIKDVDAQAGIDTGYTITTVDLSNFKTYGE